MVVDRHLVGRVTPGSRLVVTGIYCTHRWAAGQAPTRCAAGSMQQFTLTPSGGHRCSWPGGTCSIELACAAETVQMSYYSILAGLINAQHCCCGCCSKYWAQRLFLLGLRTSVCLYVCCCRCHVCCCVAPPLPGRRQWTKAPTA